MIDQRLIDYADEYKDYNEFLRKLEELGELLDPDEFAKVQKGYLKNNPYLISVNMCSHSKLSPEKLKDVIKQAVS